MSFPLQPYYANANQLRQGAAVLVVPTQLTRARTSLPGSLNHSAYSVTNIIVFLVIIVLFCYYHCLILSFIIANSQKKLGFVKNLPNYTVTNTNSSESNIHLQQSILSSDFNTFLVVSTNKAIKTFWLWLLLRKCFQLSPCGIFLCKPNTWTFCPRVFSLSIRVSSACSLAEMRLFSFEIFTFYS